MLVVDLNKANLSYDVLALVKSFYPTEDVKILTDEVAEEKRNAMDEPAIYVTVTDTKTQLLMKEEALPEIGEQMQFVWQYSKEEGAGAEFKNGFKAFVYQSLSQALDKQLAWGNLTGIRPTKIAMGMLEDGKSEAEIFDFLKSNHFLSDEKADLCVDISKREKEILADIHYQDGYSLYIGIPFCPTTCLYCSFTSYPICSYKDKVEEYIDCLIEEMKHVSELMKDKVLDSVYIGGGTPTTLEAHQLDRLITSLKQYFDFSTVVEFTVEAGRADSITREKLEVLYKHGVQRISVNPQTMKDDTLKLIGRRHTVEQAKEAFQLAREVGFTNINMDLILGLPNETVEDVEETIRQVCELKPDSLTVHSLAVKRASKLGAWIEKNDISMLKNTDETMEVARKGALSMDMKPYYLYRQKNMAGNFENVGYATEGKYGIYNILIMEEKQTIVALGAGSITKRVFPDGRIERCDNIKDVVGYMERIDEMIERKKELFKEF